MKKLLLALFVSLTPTMAMGQTKVFLGCQWTVFDHMEEAFVVDLAEKSVLWVDEEIELKIDVVSDGFITFQGEKRYVQTGKGWIENVPLSFKIDRVMGRFYVQSDKVKIDRIGKCEIGRLF